MPIQDHCDGKFFVIEKCQMATADVLESFTYRTCNREAAANWEDPCQSLAN